MSDRETAEIGNQGRRHPMSDRDKLIAEARKAANAVYIAVDEPVADDLSRIILGLVAELVRDTPRVVTTVAELRKIEHGSYIRGHDGFGHVKHLDHWILTAGSGYQHDISGIALPATVLFTPTSKETE